MLHVIIVSFDTLTFKSNQNDDTDINDTYAKQTISIKPQKNKTMKTIEFEVHTRKSLPLDIQIEITRKYPVHSHHLIESKKIRLKYTYISTNIINEKEYCNFLKKYLTKKYTTYSSSCSVEIINHKV